MKCSSIAIVLFLSMTSSTAAFSIQRRDVLGLLGGSAAAALVAATPAANAAIAKTGTASPFTGDYDDPNHPGCLRQVKVVGAPIRGDGTRPANPVIEITGYDGKEGEKMCTERPTRADLWQIQGKVKSSNTEAVIDFSPKGGPGNLLAKYEDGGIVFPDGNKWTKVPLGTKDRRPKDMSTLKSN